VQVLSNLIENAVNYGRGPKGAYVTVSAELYGESSEAVRFSVADLGAGIASEHVQRVFERFYRVDKFKID